MVPQRFADIALDLAASDSASDSDEIEHTQPLIGLYGEESDNDSF